jgi:hypothetical protein
MVVAEEEVLDGSQPEPVLEELGQLLRDGMAVPVMMFIVAAVAEVELLATAVMRLPMTAETEDREPRIALPEHLLPMAVVAAVVVPLVRVVAEQVPVAAVKEEWTMGKMLLAEQMDLEVAVAEATTLKETADLALSSSDTNTNNFKT